MCRFFDVPDHNEENRVGVDPSLQFPSLISPRQLSQGHFSHDNQQPLTGPKVELPIYEAMITEDIRLVVCKGLLINQSTLLTIFISIR